MIEPGSKRQITGRCAIVTGALTRYRLVVEADSVERTVDQIVQFRLQVRKSRERERIDPAGTGFVAREGRFIDDRNRVAKIRECRCRRGTAGSCTDDQGING